MMKKISPKTNEEILQLAKKAATNAYCPYSDFPVGACALYENGEVYLGCNVENSSYGLTLCAERNAISNAACAGEKTKLVKIAIYSPKKALCFPCGACRQWIQEFSQGYNTEIILEAEGSGIQTYFINDMLPFSFSII